MVWVLLLTVMSTILLIPVEMGTIEITEKRTRDDWAVHSDARARAGWNRQHEAWSQGTMELCLEATDAVTSASTANGPFCRQWYWSAGTTTQNDNARKLDTRWSELDPTPGVPYAGTETVAVDRGRSVNGKVVRSAGFDQLDAEIRQWHPHHRSVPMLEPQCHDGTTTRPCGHAVTLYPGWWVRATPGGSRPQAGASGSDRTLAPNPGPARYRSDVGSVTWHLERGYAARYELEGDLAPKRVHSVIEERYTIPTGEECETPAPVGGTCPLLATQDWRCVPVACANTETHARWTLPKQELKTEAIVNMATQPKRPGVARVDNSAGTLRAALTTGNGNVYGQWPVTYPAWTPGTKTLGRKAVDEIKIRHKPPTAADPSPWWPYGVN